MSQRIGMPRLRDVRANALHGVPELRAWGAGLLIRPEQFDQFRTAAGYVDRILMGEKPAACRSSS